MMLHRSQYKGRLEWRVAVAAGAILVRASLAAAQLGPGEFQVNTYTTQSQEKPSVAADAAGNFVVVWQSYGQDGGRWGIFGQRFDGSTSPVGTEFQVNNSTVNDQIFRSFGDRSVAVGADGAFVVVWETFVGSGDKDVLARRYASDGGAVGTEFRVNGYTTFYQTTPRVAANAAGDFVVVWEQTDYYSGYPGRGIFGRRYASDGTELGAPFHVNTYYSGGGFLPSIASDLDGNFVVVWVNTYGNDGSLDGIFGQRFSSSGSASGTEFLINTYTTQQQSFSSVCSDMDGDFVVVWYSFRNGGDVFARRFTSDGAAVGSEFQVSTVTGDFGNQPAVSCDLDGSFVVSWSSNLQGASVLAQSFDSNGGAVGSEFTAGTSAAYSGVAHGADGQFLIVWQSGVSDVAGGIVGQLFSGDLIFEDGFEN